MINTGLWLASNEGMEQWIPTVVPKYPIIAVSVFVSIPSFPANQQSIIPLYTPSFHVISHVLFHLILHCGWAGGGVRGGGAVTLKLFKP